MPRLFFPLILHHFYHRTEFTLGRINYIIPKEVPLGIVLMLQRDQATGDKRTAALTGLSITASGNPVTELSHLKPRQELLLNLPKENIPE